MTSSANQVFLFSDASFDRNLAAGAGAILLISAGNETPLAPEAKMMKAASIAQLEVMTVLWGLESFRNRFPTESPALTVYTDSALIEKLPARRKKLEAADFKSKRTAKRLPNATWFQTFFEFYDELQPTVIWTKGHTAARSRNQIEQLFSQVDRAARHCLREFRRKEKGAAWR